MDRPPSKQTYRLVIGALALTALLVLIVVGVVIVASLPPSPEAMAATLTALPSPTPTVTPVPTAVPTVPGVSENLLVCQREVGRAMNVRNMVGTANVSDDHRLSIGWVSTDWVVQDLEDALSGIIQAFDVALAVWEQGCRVYDRVQVDVYDGPPEARVYRLTVRATMDDLLRWRAGEYTAQALVSRLEVIQPTP